MALIKCSECGGQMSDRATECPHCGCPIEVIKQSREGLPKTDISNVNAARKKVSSLRVIVFGLLSVAIIGLILLVGKMLVKDDEVESKEDQALYNCIIYSDNNGELRNEQGDRLCAVKLYSRGEPLHIFLSSDVSWGGLSLDGIYLKEGKVYSEFPYSSKIGVLTPIASYEMSTVGSEMTFKFHALANSEQLRELALAQSAKKEQEEAERERLRLENEKLTWSGANSLEELRSKLNGTTWHTFDRGLVYQLVFENGTVKRYSARSSSGKWSDDVTYFSSYDIIQKRDAGGNNFIQVSFGNLDSDILHAPQQVAFIDKCKTAVYFFSGTPVGRLTYGEYKWSDEL